jgi:pyridoxamine 5'-phosphate oxidase-like protein
VTEPRGRARRKADTLARLTDDVDAWVATAGDGPYLVPLSFLWDGETILLSTDATTPTGRNLAASGEVRLGIGLTRDVVLVDGTVEVVPAADLPAEVGDAFAAKTGFDPRRQRTPYDYYRVRPQRIRAWREADELTGQLLMRDGTWLV